MKSRENRAVFRLSTGLKRTAITLVVIAAMMLIGIISAVRNMPTEESYATSGNCNKSAMKIADAVCLQDMNDYVIQSMEIETEYTLIDERDESTYRVAKLRDGNVWLLDNLRIGGDSEMVLTSEDTNTDPSLNNGEYVLPASGSAENTYTEPVIYTGEKDIIVDESEPWTIGGYYNYCAASAGTYCDEDQEAEGDAEYDICPAGWRMPTGGNGGEYQMVVSMYSEAIDVLHLPLSGRYYNGATGKIGEDGYFWSSTNRDGRRMYYLNRSGSSLAPDGSYRRDRGYSMRCVAKGVKTEFSCNGSAKNIDEAVCLQDMNAMVKDSMEVDKRYLMVDSRDKESYLVAKLQDGNVWLLDNLRLGGESEILLTSEDTNTNPEVNGGEFTLPASGNWVDTYTEPMIDAGRRREVQDSQNGWMIGSYYNYCAASAGTYCDEEGAAEGDAEYDVCPARWRMPTGGENGEYQGVISFYNVILTLMSTNNNSPAVNALRLPLSGRFLNGSYGMVGQDGYFWSSTNRDGSRMYYLNRSSDDVSSGSYNRDRGYSVRCIVSLKESGGGDYRWKNNRNVHVLGKEDDLTFLIDLSPESVVSVKVDGVELDSDDYKILNEGGTAIVLKRSYINGLAVDSYQLTVEYASGTVINTEFVIQEQAEEPEEESSDIVVPNTGVNNGDNQFSEGYAVMPLWLVGMIIVVIPGAILIKRYIRRKTF